MPASFVRLGPVQAGPRFAFACGALLVALASIAGCASPLADRPEAEPGTLDRRLAGRPEPTPGAEPDAPADPTGGSVGAGGGSASGPDESGGPGGLGGQEGESGNDGDTATSPSAADDASSSAGGATQAARFETLLSVDDPAADHGIEGRDYGDALALGLADDHSTLRVTVTVGGALPARFDEGEVMGIGVDIFREAGTDESDYQLFADGGSDGWFAYLDTPDGLVAYPGVFRISGDAVEFEVPWGAVGGRGPLGVSTFVDWSRGDLPVVARTTADHVPDRGTALAQPSV